MYVATRGGSDDAQRQRHEEYRRRLLTGLGVHVLLREQLPFKGFFVDPELETGFVALTHTLPRGTSYDAFLSEETRTYSRHSDPEVVDSFAKDAGISVSSLGRPSRPDLKFNPCDHQLLFGRLGTVPQYRNAKFELRDVALDENVRATQIYVKEFKCVQIDALTREFERHKVEPFLPQQIVLNGNMSTIITPPVLEEHGAYLIMIEGHTRALHALRSGRNALRAVVVSGVTAQLPARPRPLSELSIASQTLGLNSQYEDFSGPDWREIEGRVHPVEDGELDSGTAT